MKQEPETAKTVEITPELLERARAKDRDALTDLYHATSLDVYRTVHALVRDEELARDVQQDAYLQAFSHLDQLREPSSFLPWVRQIAVNEAREQLRKKRLLLFSELSDEEDADEPEIPDVRPEAQPEAALDRKETTRLVREILNGMPDGQRLIVGMYYYEQIPVNQIAEQLELSPGTVKVQLHRGRKHVEREVQKLEKKGVKLYGLSPMPFLLALLKKAMPAAETEQALLAGTLGKAGVLAETAAVQVGRSFFQTALGRTVLGVLTVAVIGGGVWGYTWVRDNLMKPMGDVQPTEQVETAEDLTTEPSSSESLPVEISADLTTEPVTEPVTEHEATPTTEPESTEPEQTEPAAPPPTQPRPTEPKPTEPKPTEPKPTEPKPTEPKPTEPKPTEPKPTEPTSGASLSWAWSNGGAMDWDADISEGIVHNLLYVDAHCQYEDSVPPYTVSTDDESVLQIIRDKPAYVNFNELLIDGFRYYWEVRALKEGTAKLFLKVNGETVKTLTVRVRNTSKLLRAGLINDGPFYENTEKTLSNTVVGRSYKFYAVVGGTVQPVFSTDNPAVIRFSDPVFAPTTPVPCYQCSVEAVVVGAGDAKITLSLNGKLDRSWNVHANNTLMEFHDSQEDLIPIDAEPQVMAWCVNTNLPMILRTGNAEALYVKMKGPNPPAVSSDNSSVAAVALDSSKTREDRNVVEYWYRITAVKSGVCTIRCSFGGQPIFNVPIVVP